MKILRISLVACGLALLFSCSNKGGSQEATEEYGSQEADVYSGEAFAICLGNNVSVRETPSPKGDRITSLAIGEKVTWRDSLVVDGDYEYALVELSDGTQGWAVVSYLFLNSRIAVVSSEATIYSRPDLLTSTNTSFQPLDLITYQIEDGTEGWYQVTGKRAGTKSFSSGWIKSGGISENEKDILMAQMVYKANEKKGAERMTAIKEVLARGEFQYQDLYSAVLELTYLDPDGFLKPELEKYYIGMVNYYDSAGHDNYYQFADAPPKVKIFNKEFGFFKYDDWKNGNHWHIWNFFYEFSTSVASQGAYDATGYYGNYYEYEDRLMAMEDLAGMPVYSHFTEDYRDFKRVNPEFINWVTNNLMPHPDNGFLGVAVQEVYDRVFRANARYTYKQWRFMNEVFDMDDLADEYAVNMDEPSFDAYRYLLDKFDFTAVDPVLAGVFMRRKIDGTRDEMINAMKKALTLYDKEWYHQVRYEDPTNFFELDESEYIGDYEEEYYEEEDEEDY